MAYCKTYCSGVALVSVLGGEAGVLGGAGVQRDAEPVSEVCNDARSVVNPAEHVGEQMAGRLGAEAAADRGGICGAGTTVGSSVGGVEQALVSTSSSAQISIMMGERKGCDMVNLRLGCTAPGFFSPGGGGSGQGRGGLGRALGVPLGLDLGAAGHQAAMVAQREQAQAGQGGQQQLDEGALHGGHDRHTRSSSRRRRTRPGSCLPPA